MTTAYTYCPFCWAPMKFDPRKPADPRNGQACDACDARNTQAVLRIALAVLPVDLALARILARVCNIERNQQEDL